MAFSSLKYSVYNIFKLQLYYVSGLQFQTEEY